MQRHELHRASGVEWLGDVPSHWDIQPLRSVTTLKADRNRPELPVLSVYREYGVILKDSRHDNHNATSLDTSTYKVVRPGDLVVNKMKAWQGSMGVSTHEGIVSPAYITCATNSDRVRPRYLHYLLRSAPLIGIYNALSYGVRVGQWDMHYEDFKQIPISLPPLPEQDRIVIFLDQKTAEIDTAIAKKEGLIELLQEQKSILIIQSVTRGMNPEAPMKDSGVSWIGKVPSSFHLTRLGFIASIGNGSTPNRGSAGYWDNGNIPWLNSSKVNDFNIYDADQFVTKRALRECHLPLVPAGSLLVAITGEGKTRGTAALTKIDATINQHLAYITVTNPVVEPEFLLYYLTGIYQILRDESSSQGSTKGAITCGELRKVPVAIPPHDEQQRILDSMKVQLHRIAQSSETARKQIEALRELRSIVVADVVSGKMKV